MSGYNVDTGIFELTPSKIRSWLRRPKYEEGESKKKDPAGNEGLVAVPYCIRSGCHRELPSNFFSIIRNSSTTTVTELRATFFCMLSTTRRATASKNEATRKAHVVGITH